MAQHTAAILTTFNECDMNAVQELRRTRQDEFTKKHGVKLGLMSFFVKAAVEALKGPQESVTTMVAEFRRRRDVIVEGLNKIHGFKCLKPHGAFYVFPNITGTGMKSKEIAGKLLEQAGVAALAGTSFGAHGEGYVRFSYANSVEQIQLGLERVGQFMGALATK